MSEKKKPLPIYLTVGQREHVDAMAEKLGLTKSGYILSLVNADIKKVKK